MGFFWIFIGPTVIYFLVNGAINNISSEGTKDINKPIPWIIIITIFLPIAIGLMIFGYYCVKGEYNKLPEKNNNDINSKAKKTISNLH